tara:strand:- start:414 stop:1013 length:600 start_codon:yes stop_codon:yes gene_type:complete
MTVRITKPEFNLRDRLSELEFKKLPYHKIPDGSVCQRSFHFAPNSGGAENETTSTSFTDASYFKPYFKPRFVDSLIMIEFTTQVKRSRDDSRYQTFRIARVNVNSTDNNTVNLEYDNAGLAFLGTYNGSSSEAVYQHILIRELDTPYTTDLLQYKLQHKTSNSDMTVRLGENGHNRRLICTISEIKGLAGLSRGRFLNS